VKILGLVVAPWNLFGLVQHVTYRL
jgi:hypothetical protein